MEQSSSSPRSSRREGLLSCWGRLKLKLPWTKKTSIYKPIGGFGYDPLSYAQNFDEGWVEGDEQSSRRRFSARYAAPSGQLNRSSIDKVGALKPKTSRVNVDYQLERPDAWISPEK